MPKKPKNKLNKKKESKPIKEEPLLKNETIELKP